MRIKILAFAAACAMFMYGCAAVQCAQPPQVNHVPENVKMTVQVLYDLIIASPAGPVPAGIRGSGVVLEVSGDRSLVVTANHVVDVPDKIEEDGQLVAEVVVKELTIKTHAGKSCKADVIFQNKAFDIAFLDVSCVAGDPAPRASRAPEVGDRVIAIGGAIGYHPDYVWSITSGEFIGFDRQYYVSSAPVAPGDSGGGLWNSSGELIGIIDAVNARFEHIGFSVPVPIVDALYRVVREDAWKR